MMSKNKNVTIENARICFRNFAGKEGRFNAAGRRNFCVLLDDHLADQMKEDGWNVKYLNPRDESETPQPYIQVVVRYANIPPKVVLVTSRGKSVLNEDTIDTLDYAEIENVDLIFSPYNWDLGGGRSGITAYLKTMYVTLAEDEFESKYYGTPDSAYDAVGGCGNCEECDGHCKDYR